LIAVAQLDLLVSVLRLSSKSPFLKILLVKYFLTAITGVSAITNIT